MQGLCLDRLTRLDFRNSQVYRPTRCVGECAVTIMLCNHLRWVRGRTTVSAGTSATSIAQRKEMVPALSQLGPIKKYFA